MTRDTTVRRIPVRRYLVFILILLAVTLGIGEVFARVLYTRLTPVQGRKAVSFMRGEWSEYAKMSIQPHPYMLYVNAPKWQANGVEQHNSYGHRSAEISLKRPPNTLRVLAMGGSTTYGYLLDFPKQTWPNQLEGLLEERLPGLNVEVINAGLNYGMSSDLLAHYLFQDRFFGAQVVIFHVGGNDVAPLLMEDYRPDYGNFRRWRPSPFGIRPGEQAILHSALARVAYAWWFSKTDSSAFLYDPGVFDIPVDQMVKNVKKNYPLGYERNLEALTRNALDDQAIPILFPFYQAEESVFELLKPPMDHAKPFYPAVTIGNQKEYAIMKAVAERFGVPYAQLPQGSIPLQDFFDHTHLKEHGEGVKARFMADEVMQLIKIGRVKLETSAHPQ